MPPDLEKGVAGFHDVLVPERELFQGYYRWFTYSPEQLGLKLVCLQDIRTGTVVSTPLVAPDKNVGAIKAWAGGRHSRSSGSPLEIIREIAVKNVDTDAKVRSFVTGYGHVSIGDMAGGIMAHFHGVPMHLPMEMFNLSAVHSGQEKSTRFQAKFSAATLHDMGNYLPDEMEQVQKEEFSKLIEKLGNKAIDLYRKHGPLIERMLRIKFNPQNDKENASLGSRNLDIIRGFLLLGFGTGFSYETSAREWSQVIGKLKSSHVPYYLRVANQLETLLSPSSEVEEALGFKSEAPGLIRHTEPANLTNENLKGLKSYVEKSTDLLKTVGINREFRGQASQRVELLPSDVSPGDKIAMQYLLTLWPGLDKQQLTRWLVGQPDLVKAELGQRIFGGHNNYLELPNIAATNDLSFFMEAQLKVVRDLNRHRPDERFIGVPLIYGGQWTYDKAVQIVSRGFATSNYLNQVEEFSEAEAEFVADLNGYYREVLETLAEIKQKYGDSIDWTFAANLLSLSHLVDFNLQGNIRQINYLTNQRVRNGGDIDYRDLVWQMDSLMREGNPYLSQTSMTVDQHPDVHNRHQFFDRS